MFNFSSETQIFLIFAKIFSLIPSLVSYNITTLFPFLPRQVSPIPGNFRPSYSCPSFVLHFFHHSSLGSLFHHSSFCSLFSSVLFMFSFPFCSPYRDSATRFSSPFFLFVLLIETVARDCPPLFSFIVYQHIALRL